MLKTVTMFKWDHDEFTKLIESGALPQPSMHFVTGPVHLGKEGEDEIINDVYFHTFEIDKGNEELMRFFESIANYINTWLRSRQLPNNGYVEFVFDRQYCRFMRLYKNIEDAIIDHHVVSFSDVINTWLMQSIIIERKHKTFSLKPLYDLVDKLKRKEGTI